MAMRSPQNMGLKKSILAWVIGTAIVSPLKKDCRLIPDAASEAS